MCTSLSPTIVARRSPVWPYLFSMGKGVRAVGNVSANDEEASVHGQVTRIRIARALPLLNRLGVRGTEKAALFWYLDAMVQVAEGTSSIIHRSRTDVGETVVIRDLQSGEEWEVARPAALPPAIEARVVGEYQRLVAEERLSAMDAVLFAYLFRASYCTNCRYGGERQICFECRYAGDPVNFLPFEPEAAPPLQTASYDP